MESSCAAMFSYIFFLMSADLMLGNSMWLLASRLQSVSFFSLSEYIAILDSLFT
jgi:hypothetical protein